MKITYRKTKQGTWVAYGPAAEITAGATVTVTKANGGTKTERIESAGKPFTVNGTEMAYGYLAPRAAATSDAPAGFASSRDRNEYRRNRSAYSRRQCVTGGNCSSFGNGRSCGAPDCDGY